MERNAILRKVKMLPSDLKQARRRVLSLVKGRLHKGVANSLAASGDWAEHPAISVLFQKVSLES